MKKLSLLILLFLPFCHLQAQETVVCIPGFLVPHRHMHKIQSLFKCTTMNAEIWHYSLRECSLEGSAAKLCSLLQQQANCSPGEPIHFVCHSVGALVLKITLNRDDCPEEARIGRIVLLAPCSHGSVLARRVKGLSFVEWIMGGKAGWQLINYSPEVINCRYGDFPSSPSYLVLVGNKGIDWLFDVPNDGYLTVDETAISAPNTRYILPLSHSELLKNRCSLSLIKSFILTDGE